jgi:hypothetical protein
MGLMTDHNTLEWLQAENARLIALLKAHDIEWRLLPEKPLITLVINGDFWK